MVLDINENKIPEPEISTAQPEQFKRKESISSAKISLHNSPKDDFEMFKFETAALMRGGTRSFWKNLKTEYKQFRGDVKSISDELKDGMKDIRRQMSTKPPVPRQSKVKTIAVDQTTGKLMKLKIKKSEGSKSKPPKAQNSSEKPPKASKSSTKLGDTTAQRSLNTESASAPTSATNIRSNLTEITRCDSPILHKNLKLLKRASSLCSVYAPSSGGRSESRSLDQTPNSFDKTSDSGSFYGNPNCSYQNLSLNERSNSLCSSSERMTTSVSYCQMNDSSCDLQDLDTDDEI